MPYEETAYSTKETPRLSLLRWVHSRFRPSAIGGGVFALLVVILAVGGLIDTRASGPLATEARQEAWKFLHPWIAQCDGFHYIAFSGSKTPTPTPGAYYIVQLKGFELQVTAAPRHAVNLEWRGVVTARAQAVRVFYSETGQWTPWSDWRQLGGINVFVSLIKWDDQGEKSPMWEVDKYDLASMDKAHAALSCETVTRYLTGGDSRSPGTIPARVPNLRHIHHLREAALPWGGGTPAEGLTPAPAAGTKALAGKVSPLLSERLYHSLLDSFPHCDAEDTVMLSDGEPAVQL